MLATGLALASLGGDALAHAGDHGELTFHDDEDAPAQASVDPTQPPVELDCEFWIQGTGMSHEQGTIEAVPGAWLTQPATLGTWQASADGNGTYAFEAGPFQLPETAVYRVWAQIDDHRTRAHEVAYTECGGDSGGPVQPPGDID